MDAHEATRRFHAHGGAHVATAYSHLIVQTARHLTGTCGAEDGLSQLDRTWQEGTVTHATYVTVDCPVDHGTATDPAPLAELVEIADALRPAGGWYSGDDRVENLRRAVTGDAVRGLGYDAMTVLGDVRCRAAALVPQS